MGDDEAEVRRKFQAVTSGQELVELRDLASMLLGPPVVEEEPRPSLRRPPLAQPHVLGLRVELDHADPPIWRGLEVRSDVTLADLHEVLLAAYGWGGGHLHRFAVGGGPFDPGSELFLCPFDVEEGEDPGVATALVRLDEVLQEPGDVLRYVYDYGDSWDVTIRLEQLRPADAETRVATCTGGERAAPPEDCGGLTDAIDLVDLLDDPAAFDPREVDAALRSPYVAARELGVHPVLAEMVARLAGTPLGDDLVERLLDPRTHPEPDDAAVAAAFRAHRWFLDRAYGDGIPLTEAGYLRPADVAAAAALVPSAQTFPGSRTREAHVPPVLDFRTSLQSLGLLRKAKGRLLLTKAGEAARTDVAALREHVVRRLAPRGVDRFGHEAGLLVLAYAATSPDGPLPLAKVARLLGELGWSRGGEPLRHFHLLHVVPAVALLREVTDRPVDPLAREHVSLVAAAVARDVVFGR